MTKLDKDRIIPAVLARIALGTLVTDACQLEGVTRETLNQWCRADPALSDAYARAREQQSHALAEQALAIAHGDDALTERRADAIDAAGVELAATGVKDWRKVVSKLEGNLIQRDRLRVDTLKWLTSKIAPKLYGEKVSLEHTGEDGAPIVVQIVREGRRSGKPVTPVTADADSTSGDVARRNTLSSTSTRKR